MPCVKVLVLIAAVMLMPIPASGQSSEKITLDCPDAESTVIAGINDAGRAVGFYFLDGVPHGFITDGRHGCEAIPGLPDGYMPLNLNDSEHIIGFYIENEQQRGFVYREGREVIHLSFGIQTFPIGIDNRGRVVGFYQLEDGTGDRAFVWEDGTFVELNPNLPWPSAGEEDSVSASGINPRGDIAGQWLYETEDGNESDDADLGYVWRRGQAPQSFGFPVSESLTAKVTSPTSMNARGDIVGFFYESMTPGEAEADGALFGPCRGFFRDRDGTMTELRYPDPTATYTCTLGLNAAGEISGIWTDDTRIGGFAGVKWHGFIAKKEALVVQQP